MNLSGRTPPGGFDRGSGPVRGGGRGRRRSASRRSAQRSARGNAFGRETLPYYDRKVYVDGAGRRRLPAWATPVAVTALLAVLVFVVAPLAVAALSSFFGDREPNNGHPAVRILSEATRVVRATAADVLDRPDLRADRITQVLYNAPVKVVDADAAYGYAAVELPDGMRGYVASDRLTDARDSAEPYLYRYKLVVADRVRRIMSHASQGTLLQEVMMGTVLYADYRGDGIYRVALAGGGTGWIGSNGLIELPVDGTVQESGAAAFVASAMAFLGMTYLPGGLTQDGIDTQGLVQVAAAVNGRTIPHAFDGIAGSGASVPLEKDEKTGTWATTAWRSGDLVLFGPVTPVPVATSTPGAAKPLTPTSAALTATPMPEAPVYADVALYVGEGQVLMSRANRSSVRLVTLADEPALLARVVAVRRLFANP